MQRYTNVAQDALGNVIQGMSVSVFLHGTQTLATIYSDNGITTIPNPVTTDALGTFAFYAADGRYDLQLSKTGLPTTNLLDVLLNDPVDPNVGDVAVVATIAALKALASAQLVGQVQTLGYYAAGDGGSALYRWNSTDVTADNGGTVVAPNAGGTGRWNILYNGHVQGSWFGVLPTATAGQNTSALSALEAFATGLGITIEYPQGTINLNGPWVWKNNITRIGQGMNATGTSFVVAGTSDGIQINNPLNSNTAAWTRARGFNVTSSTKTTGRATLVDNGSSLMVLEDIGLFGNDFPLILNQTEVADFYGVNFQPPANAQAALWQVNGPESVFAWSGGATYSKNATVKGSDANYYQSVNDGNVGHDPTLGGGFWTNIGAVINAGFSNRLGFHGCNLNGTGTTVGAALDGGNDVSFNFCNFNAMAKHIRANGVNTLTVRSGEAEIATTASIEFNNTKLGGGAGGTSGSATIQGVYFSQGALPCVSVVNASSLSDLSLISNTYNTTGAVYSGMNNCPQVFARGNVQQGAGTAYKDINNFYDDQSYTTTWTASVVNPTIGNGSITSTFARAGRKVTVNLKIVWGGTTTNGTGDYSFSLPYTAKADSVDYMGAGRASQATFFVLGTIIPSGSVTMLANSNNTGTSVGSANPAAWANGNQLHLTCAYDAANIVG